jgi:hypothetical protein
LPPSLSPSPSSAVAPAFQVVNKSDGSQSCASAGSLFSYTDTKLFDSTDPSAGAVLTYHNGDPVGPSCSMAFSIVFQCADMPFPAAANPYIRWGRFEQVNQCQYMAYTWSQAGCPAGETGGRGGRAAESAGEAAGR